MSRAASTRKGKQSRCWWTFTDGNAGRVCLLFPTPSDTFGLPKLPLDVLVGEKAAASLPPFDDVSRAAVSHILTTFCTHESPSVQATLYITGGKLLDDPSAKAVQTVDLQMPNRHYIPIDLSWAKLENVKADEAEVFLPSAHPRWVS